MKEQQGKFNSKQLQMYITNGVPLSHFNHQPKEEDKETMSKNLVLPKMLPDIFSMSFYNPAGRIRGKA